MRKSLFILLLLAGVSTLAFGDQIFVCQSCTNPPGGDPNFITNPSSFDIGLAGAGHVTQTGVLVFVGVYDGTSSTATPTLTFNGSSVVLSGLGDWGETMQQFNMIAGQDAYVDMGLNDINGGNSETFSNWNIGEGKAGIAPATSFELFAYDVPTALTGNSSVVVNLSGVNKGTFVVAFSCGPNGQCHKSTVYPNVGHGSQGDTDDRDFDWILLAAPASVDSDGGVHCAGRPPADGHATAA